ncbi:hypothetical protein [Desmospora activa]|uniref:Uncharacterized protein n=1 Tax=Desmospora activa DSM 45169 TaxID=1121389 RepID=A0A2T4Z8X7_9BACL|nr:hypothetical protein [Desmospora activa]PTM58352.1 hypothetical protein C8J48_0934 [Desmospora activa DSM 45169]
MRIIPELHDFILVRDSEYDVWEEGIVVEVNGKASDPEISMSVVIVEEGEDKGRMLHIDDVELRHGVTWVISEDAWDALVEARLCKEKSGD